MIDSAHLSGPAPVARLAVVSNFLPRHDAASSNLRVLSLLRLLMARGTRVDYFHFNATDEDERYARDLGTPARRLPEEPVAAAEAVADARPEAVWLTNLWTPGFLRLQSGILRRLRRILPGSPVLLDTMDLHARKYERLHALSGDPAHLDKAREFLELEREAYPLAHVVLAVSAGEREAILEAVPGCAPVAVVPNVHAPAGDPPPLAIRRGLVFLGNFHVDHNEDAARWFADRVLPLIHERRPGTRLTFAGRGSDTVLADLASQDVRLTGYVPDVETELGRHRVFVCPMRYGAGMKGKAGAAAACGLPMVSTTLGAEGFDFEDGEHCLIADSPQAFARDAGLLLEDDDVWTRIGRAARTYAAQRLSPDAAARALERAFRLCGRTGAGREGVA